MSNDKSKAIADFWDEQWKKNDDFVKLQASYWDLDEGWKDQEDRDRWEKEQEQKEHQKKLDQHHDSLRIKLSHYIQNSLPIRLIQVSDMALVDRAMLQKQTSQRISQEIFICNEEDCPCFKKIKDELKYSILSHRWSSSELAFSEYKKLYEQVTQHNRLSIEKIVSKMQKALEGTEFESSLDKLLHFHQLSAQSQCKYAWVDTICINKESSAELDESIRSMYAWYRDSHICIAHLSQTHHSLEMENDTWFTRGWTLQELLAPKQIKFLSASWNEITSRANDKDLSDMGQQAARIGQDNPPLWSMISRITGIPIDDLLDFKPGLYDIGKRMTWASKRKTTRVEDMAYCLIGIFRVNLSTAYGEKEGAFYRLQVEIMQNCDDDTLFDWRGSASAYNSMFAASPECFSRALGLVANDKWKAPVSGGQISISSANFERRVSRELYDKSKYPEFGIWEETGATAFIVLGHSSASEEFVLLLLKQLSNDRHYKRLDVIKTKVDSRNLPKESLREILIK